MSRKDTREAPRLAASNSSTSRPLPDLPEHRQKLSFDRDTAPPFNAAPAEKTESTQQRTASKALNPLGISVNTNVSRHHAKTPEQVFPESDTSCAQKVSGERQKTLPSSRLSHFRRNDRIKRLQLQGISSPNGNNALGFVASLSQGTGQNTLLQRNRNVSEPIKTPRIVITPTEGPARAPSPDSADCELTPTPPLPASLLSQYSCAAQSESTPPCAPMFALASFQGGENKAAAWPVQNNLHSSSEKSFVTSPEFPEGTRSQGLEEDSPPMHSASAYSPRRSSQETILPTPKRSSGWWNYLSSPFSAFGSGTPKTARSRFSTVTYPDEDMMQTAPLVPTAAPIVGYGAVNVGEAAAYYDPTVSFDTPKQHEDWDANGKEATSGDGIFGAREVSLDVTQKYGPEAAIIAQNNRKFHSPDPNLHLSPRVDQQSEGRTREFDPPQRGFGSYKRYEVDSPTSPSPILGIATVSQFKSLGRSKDTGEESEQIKLVTHTPEPKTASPLPSSSISQRPPNDFPDNEESSSPPAIYNAAKGDPFQMSSAPHPPASARSSPMLKQESARLPPPSLESEKMSLPRTLPAQEKSRWVAAPFAESNQTKKTPKRRDYLFLGLAGLLLVLVALSIALALFIKPVNNTVSIQAQWLNLTGFPPIPTGISTIAKPNLANEVSGCVEQESMWTCQVPKTRHPSSAVGQTSHPNFRFEIRFDNSTIADKSLTQLALSKRGLNPNHGAGPGSDVVTSLKGLMKRSLAPMLQVPMPAPPTEMDREFLGNTTDGAKQPFGGEETPFFISFLQLTPLPSSSLSKRQSTTPLSNLTSKIPHPLLNMDTDNLPPASLYPLPASQPLRLYNRGLDSEYYGFYIYFDKSIYLSAPTISSTNSTSFQLDASNAQGGVPQSDADTLCIFSQTRYQVQIWTRQSQASLLVPPSSAPKNATRWHTMANGTLTANNPVPDEATASAFGFEAPGSFPLPVTVTVDRHGGAPGEKAVYCYGLREGGQDVLPGAKIVLEEDRAFGGGGLVNAARPFASVDLEERGWEGVDGGIGGCRCEWRNWT